MTETVDLNGIEVEVTPVNELDPIRAMAGLVLIDKLGNVLDENNVSKLVEIQCELIALCIDEPEGITADGVRAADQQTITTLTEAAMGDLLDGGEA